jgi:predicted acyltransferase
MIRIGDTSLRSWVYQNLFASWLAPINASLGFALLVVLFWMGVMGVLYWRRIFIKV